ncbi:hypothetical protein LAZ67_4003958, partial [Cordylochernes scorpioides]
MPFEILLGEPTMKNFKIQWDFHSDNIKCLALNANEYAFTINDVQENFPSLCEFSRIRVPKFEVDFLLKPDCNVIRSKPYSTSEYKRKWISDKIKEMLDRGIIVPSTSEFASPCVLVPKKDSSFRLCQDYRRLNRETHLDPFPFPSVDRIIDRFGGCHYFTKIDLRDGFWQIGLTKESRKFSAFVTQEGLYEFTRLPFGWKNSPPKFQRIMTEILGNLLDQRVVVYIDDICCGAPTKEECAALSYKILTRLAKFDMTINLGKCQFCVPQVELLGRIINGDFKHMRDQVIEKVKNMRRPYNLKSLQCFTGLTGRFRPYIPNYAMIIRPLDALKRKDSIFTWTEECEESYLKLLALITSNPILRIPDCSLQYELSTGASYYGTGAVLYQRDITEKKNRQLRVISYYSYTFTRAEQNYSVTEKECLAVLKAVKHYRAYLECKPFTVHTDHRALTQLLSCGNLRDRLARWQLFLSSFEMNINHRSGKELQDADAFSRLAIDSTTDPNESILWTNHRSIDLKLGDNNKYLVPPEDRDSILHLYHDDPLSGGHSGFLRTYHKLRQRFYWYKMKNDIRSYIASCPVCQQVKFKYKYRLNHMSLPPQSQEPFHTVHLDYAEAPTKGDARSTFLIVIDAATRLAQAKAIKQDGRSLINYFEQHENLKKVRSIITDQGKSFVHGKFPEWAKSKNIRLITTTPYHPAGNGLAERTIREIKTFLACYPHFKGGWKSCLEGAIGYHNRSYNSYLGCSPIFKYTKQSPRFPADDELGVLGRGSAKTNGGESGKIVERMRAVNILFEVAHSDLGIEQKSSLTVVRVLNPTSAAVEDMAASDIVRVQAVRALRAVEEELGWNAVDVGNAGCRFFRRIFEAGHHHGVLARLGVEIESTAFGADIGECLLVSALIILLALTYWILVKTIVLSSAAVVKRRLRASDFVGHLAGLGDGVEEKDTWTAIGLFDLFIAYVELLASRGIVGEKTSVSYRTTIREQKSFVLWADETSSFAVPAFMPLMAFVRVALENPAIFFLTLELRGQYGSFARNVGCWLAVIGHLVKSLPIRANKHLLIPVNTEIELVAFGSEVGVHANPAITRVSAHLGIDVDELGGEDAADERGGDAGFGGDVEEPSRSAVTRQHPASSKAEVECCTAGSVVRVKSILATFAIWVSHRSTSYQFVRLAGIVARERPLAEGQTLRTFEGPCLAVETEVERGAVRSVVGIVGVGQPLAGVGEGRVASHAGRLEAALGQGAEEGPGGTHQLPRQSGAALEVTLAAVVVVRVESVGSVRTGHGLARHVLATTPSLPVEPSGSGTGDFSRQIRMVETRSGKMQDPAQERIKAEESAKPQPGATIGGDASSDPVVLNPNIDIPKYDGTEDPRPWIESLEEIGFLYHWADYIISRYAAMNMIGSAKTWLNLHKISFTSWENFKSRLIEDFASDANKEEMKMRLNRMQQWNEPAIRNRTEDGRPICFKCNKPGHVARYCRVKFVRIVEEDPSVSQDKSQENLQMDERKDYTRPRLYADVWLCEALIDTDADLSVVDLRTALFAGREINSLTKTCSGPDGKKLDMVGSIILDLKIDDTELSHEFVVMDAHLRTLILGRDFLKKMNAKIDCKRETIKYNLMSNHDVSNYDLKKIKSTTDTVIPKLSIKLIRASMEAEDGEYVIEENNKMTQTNGLRLARSLLTVTDKKTHIWITNPYPRPLKIMKDQTLAYGSLPAEVNFIENIEKQNENDEIQFQINKNLSFKEQERLKQILAKYTDLFSSRLGRTNLAKHQIHTEDAKPIKHKPYRVSAKERTIIKDQIDEMLEEGIIRPSSSPWPFPVILVKKRDGKYRFCVDYRKLNEVTVKDVYPIPRIDDVMDSLQGSKYFSAIDLKSGYWQVEIEERDKEKTAFTTAHGLYEFNVMPFGLCNAPATFERNMENMLGNLRWQICLCYLDDVIIYSPDFPTHLKRLEAVFRCFRESNLRLNDKKCRFVFEELEILGYITSKHGIKPAEHNIKAIRNFPRPTKVKEVQSFLGMCSYYRKFIKDFSKIADPLTNLIKKSVSFTWTERQEEAFQTLKTALLSPPILGHFNPNAPTYIHTDASNIGIGATLVQDIGGEEKVISYLSRTLSKAEQNYSTTEKECLAVVWSMSKLPPYLYGRHFKIVTDHHALCWLKNLKDPTGRLARWALKIQEYDFDIIHKSGKKHLDADGLSRGPLPETDWDEDFERLFLNQITDEEDKFIESVKKNLNGSRRSIAQNFKEEDGCLFKKNPNSEGRAWLLVVPEKKKREIMKEYHNHMSNGHLGVARTMYRIKSKYFWPSMLKDVSEFVKTCHLCQSRKGSNQLPSGLLQPIPPANFPFERIGIDFVAPLPSTKNRKKWIIVLTDYYTRYAETRAVSEATVKEVSKFLVEDIFLRHGAPQYLISDRGSQFTSNLMKKVMKTCKIKHCFTTSYHPQTNGLTERLNRTLINMLSMYVNTDQKNWDEILPFITHAYNTTIQETTGYSPFFLMFGREPTSLLDDRNISVDIDKDDYDEYIKHHLDKINRTRKLVINNTIKTQEKMKKNYDKKHMERSYEPGELVAVWTPIRKIGKCEKVLRKYFGPYRILKKLPNVNYLIEPKDNPGQDPLIVHVSRIKPYFERIDEVNHED